MKEIERIIEKAKDKEQPVTAIKNGFKALLTRGDKLKGYSPQEVQAIRKAAETGVVTDVIKLAGSGLVPIGAGIVGGSGGIVGGALGALTGAAIQQSAKKLGTARQMGRAENALKATAKSSGMVIPSAKYGSKKITPEMIDQILSLPPDQARAAIDALKKGKK